MALITTIGEFKKYIAIDANTKMETLAPYVNEAEQLFLVDLLGKDFYDEFVTAYAASVAPTPAPLSADNLAMLPYIQRALSYYTQLLAITHLSVTFGEMGIRTHRGEDSDVAARWQQEKLQSNALRNGDLHADKLLEFLEANASVSKYTTWFASTANTKLSGIIVYGTIIAQKHIDISNSRRLFVKLLSTIKQWEKRFVPQLVGQDQYDELVTQLNTGSLTAANTLLVNRLESIISKRALFERLPYLRVSIAGDGVWLYSDMSELRSKDFLASKDEIKMLREDLMDGDLGFLADERELRRFILDNIGDYLLIAATPIYTNQPDPGPTWHTKNSADTKHFSV